MNILKVSITVIVAIILSSINPQDGYTGTSSLTSLTQTIVVKPKIKRAKSSVQYYPNSTASFNLILSGDVELNPGPGLPAPKCNKCEKTVKSNNKRLICSSCFDVTHAKCSNLTDRHNIQARTPHYHTCQNCLHTLLPFAHVPNLNISNPTNEVDLVNQSIIPIQGNVNNLKFLHINTQSLLSSFDEFKILLDTRKFDIVAMSETWLKDNPALLQYVQIQDYELYYSNRDKIKGGGVGCYVNSSLKCKRRTDIEKLDKEIEHLWLEIPGQNKHSKLLIGVIYRSNKFFTANEWIDRFENLLSKIKIICDFPVLISGDFNINMLDSEKREVKEFQSTLTQFNLDQLINNPTRTTEKSSTLIDLIITDQKNIVKESGVLPCTNISDHDGVYAILKIKLPRYEQRFKYIRSEKTFNQGDFIQDMSRVPFHVVYGIDDPELQLDIFNQLFTSCLNEHAPLKKIKVDRPPAPWMQKSEIKKTILERNDLRKQAHKTSDPVLWNKFRELKNLSKKKIRQAKTEYYRKALNSPKPKEVWKIINSILHPPPNRIKIKPSDLNSHFASTAFRTIGKLPVPKSDIKTFIQNADINDETSFRLRPGTYSAVLKIIKNMRNDTSTGPDQIPSKFIKMVAEHICSPLTYIINTFISQNKYPNPWKQSRIVPINKISNPVDRSDYRPISILPCLSKIFEKIVLHQLVDFIDTTAIYKETVSGFRKGHSTGTALLKLRDDIKQAMKAGEVTLVVLVDFSKAFDTICHHSLIKKMSKLGFSKQFLYWTLSYLSDRSQFVQIDADKSEKVPIHHGVPQGSILGPVLFNLYVNDLQDVVNTSTIQYADDTTIYKSCRPGNINSAETDINNYLNSLSSWSTKNSLAANSIKTKYMICSTSRLSKLHGIETHQSNITFTDIPLEREKSTKLLGIQIDEHLTWQYQLNNVLSSCYGSLSTLRKLKHFTTFKLRKQLVEALILSKLDFNDFVYSLSSTKLNKLQRLQLAACSFVYGRYCNIEDIIKLKWLPIKERRDMNLLKITHKALNSASWPSTCRLELHTHSKTLRNSNETRLKPSNITGIFQDTASKVFNCLPLKLKNDTNYKTFCRNTKSYLLDAAMTRS